MSARFAFIAKLRDRQIEMFYSIQKTVGNAIVGIATYLWCHLTYNPRGFGWLVGWFGV